MLVGSTKQLQKAQEEVVIDGRVIIITQINALLWSGMGTFKSKNGQIKLATSQKATATQGDEAYWNWCHPVGSAWIGTGT